MRKLVGSVGQRVGRAVGQTRTAGAVRALASLRGPLADADPPSRTGLVYRAPARGRPPLADVWLPDGPGPHPSVVWIHGGGFAVGHRAMKPMRLLATACRRAGVAAVSVDYRLVLRGGRLAEGVEDVVAAVEWWAAQAERFELDPEAISLGGLSAGGCLALLASARLGHRLAGVVSVFALYDIADLDRGPARLLGRLVAGPDPAQRRACSPVCAPPVPCPLLMVHGGEDVLVPVAQAEAYAEARRQQGLPTRLRIFPQAPHGFFNHPETPAAVEAAAEITAWLRQPR